MGRRVPTLTGGPKASVRRQSKTGKAPGAAGAKVPRRRTQHSLGTARRPEWLVWSSRTGKKEQWPQGKWRRHPRALSQKGTGVREPPLPGTASPDSNSSRSSQGEWCSCGQFSKCWIQRGPWEKRLSSGTNHSCLSFTRGSEAGLSKLALQNKDLAAPSKPGPFQQLPLCPEPPRPPS